MGRWRVRNAKEMSLRAPDRPLTIKQRIEECQDTEVHT